MRNRERSDGPNFPEKPKIIRRGLTGSRIDYCLILYTILIDLYEENDKDELEYNYLFNEIMKRSRGRFNPGFIKSELEKI